MATFEKLASGKWRVRVRHQGHALTRSFCARTMPSSPGAASRFSSSATTSYVRKCGNRSGNRSPSAEVISGFKLTSSKRLPSSRNELSAIANTGSWTRYIGPHRPQHEMQIQAEDPSNLQGRRCALTALAERGSPAWRRPLEESPIVATALEDSVRSTQQE